MRKQTIIFYSLIVLILFCSCNKKETALEILRKTIHTIDTVETIYYKQDMSRSNPQNIEDSIFRYREMYFKRLITDSIVGVKGHWYMYINDKETVVYEDIYDGNKLIRKNNKVKAAKIYDLLKYPDFRKKHFWSHNTPYLMQHEFRYILDNTDSYKIERSNDTLINNRYCYQIIVRLENKITMPGYGIQLEDSEGSISISSYFIDIETYYPIRIHIVNYFTENPKEKIFIDQRYYDIKFNLSLDEDVQFNTSDESMRGFEQEEIIPD